MEFFLDYRLFVKIRIMCRVIIAVFQPLVPFVIDNASQHWVRLSGNSVLAHFVYLKPIDKDTNSL